MSGERSSTFLSLVIVCALFALSVAAHQKREHPLPIRPGVLDAFASKHEDNWAVIVATSRFWHNYRHTTNALLVYRMARDSGITDSHIVLMLADDTSCDPRNSYPGTTHAVHGLTQNVMCGDVEVDYAGDSVTAINFLRVLTGRVPATSAERQHIFPGPSSNVLVYITGHSGEHFMKFHDYDFMTSYDLANAINVMHATQRYQRLFFVVDTCQAETLYTHITAPNVLSLASSREYQNSISHHHHYADELGNPLVDGFTSEWSTLFRHQFAAAISGAAFPQVSIPRAVSLPNFFALLNADLINSNPVWSHERNGTMFQVARDHWMLGDFFGPGYAGAVKPANVAPAGGSGWTWL